MDNAAPGVIVAGSGLPAAPLILTLDIGSSSTRAALYDWLARRVAGAEAAASNAFVHGQRWAASRPTPPALLATAAECIDAVLAYKPARWRTQIAAVALDTLVSSIVRCRCGGAAA
jgi:gluconokinase